MPAHVTVKFPDAKLRQLEHLFREFPKVLPTIMPRAINRTMRTTRARAAREIKAGTPKLKVGYIKKRMREDKASRHAWRGKLSLSPHAISLSKFAYKPTKAGVPFAIQNGRVIAKRAFRIRGTGAVLVRESAEYGWGGFDYQTGFDDGNEHLVKRLPIHKLTGPSLAELFVEAPSVVARVTGEAGEVLNKNIDQQVQFALIRRMPR